VERHWISVPVGRSGVRVGESWGGNQHAPGEAWANFLGVVILLALLLFIGYWVLVAFTIFLVGRAVWRFAQGRWVNGIMWVVIAGCLGFGELVLYQAWNASVEREGNERNTVEMQRVSP
jgi:hypothetical protein